MPLCAFDYFMAQNSKQNLIFQKKALHWKVTKANQTSDIVTPDWLPTIAGSLLYSLETSNSVCIISGTSYVFCANLKWL